MKTMRRFLAVLAAVAFVFTLGFPAVTVQAATQDVFFDGNGGTFQIIDPNWTGPTTVDYFGAFGEAGTTIASENMAVTDPVFYNNARQFLGWLPCGMQFVDSISFNYVPLTSGPVTTQYMNTQFVIPNHQVVCVAQWSGDDADYYSTVSLLGYGVEITYSESRWNPEDGEYFEDVKMEERTDYLNEFRGETIGEQTSYSTVKGIPVKEGATFEGWLEFAMEEKDDAAGVRTEYTLVSGTPITTEELMNRQVPRYDVAFVAKWSDIPVEEYFADQEKPVVEEVVIPGVDEEFALVMDESIEIPEAAAGQYDTVEKVEEALKQVVFADGALNEEYADVAYMEIVLKVKTPNGWFEVSGESFPAEGLEVVIPYPAGTDKDTFEFAVSHLISSGNKAGQIEVLEHTEGADGLTVKVYSLSPFAVAYQEILTDGESGATGDLSTIMIWVGVVLIGIGALQMGHRKLRRS